MKLKDTLWTIPSSCILMNELEIIQCLYACRLKSNGYRSKTITIISIWVEFASLISKCIRKKFSPIVIEYLHHSFGLIANSTFRLEYSTTFHMQKNITKAWCCFSKLPWKSTLVWCNNEKKSLDWFNTK